jgi:hypothetical protein
MGQINNLGGCLKGRGNGGSHERVTCSWASPHISNFDFVHFQIPHHFLAPPIEFHVG